MTSYSIHQACDTCKRTYMFMEHVCAISVAIEEFIGGHFDLVFSGILLVCVVTVIGLSIIHYFVL